MNTYDAFYLCTCINLFLRNVITHIQMLLAQHFTRSILSRNIVARTYILINYRRVLVSRSIKVYSYRLQLCSATFSITPWRESLDLITDKHNMRVTR